MAMIDQSASFHEDELVFARLSPKSQAKESVTNIIMDPPSSTTSVKQRRGSTTDLMKMMLKTPIKTVKSTVKLSKKIGGAVGDALTSNSHHGGKSIKAIPALPDFCDDHSTEPDLLPNNEAAAKEEQEEEEDEKGPPLTTVGRERRKTGRSRSTSRTRKGGGQRAQSRSKRRGNSANPEGRSSRTRGSSNKPRRGRRATTNMVIHNNNHNDSSAATSSSSMRRCSSGADLISLRKNAGKGSLNLKLGQSKSGENLSSMRMSSMRKSMSSLNLGGSKSGENLLHMRKSMSSGENLSSLRKHNNTNGSSSDRQNINMRASCSNLLNQRNWQQQQQQANHNNHNNEPSASNNRSKSRRSINSHHEKDDRGRSKSGRKTTTSHRDGSVGRGRAPPMKQRASIGMSMSRPRSSSRGRNKSGASSNPHKELLSNNNTAATTSQSIDNNNKQPSFASLVMAKAQEEIMKRNTNDNHQHNASWKSADTEPPKTPVMNQRSSFAISRSGSARGLLAKAAAQANGKSPERDLLAAAAAFRQSSSLAEARAPGTMAKQRASLCHLYSSPTTVEQQTPKAEATKSVPQTTPPPIKKEESQRTDATQSLSSSQEFKPYITPAGHVHKDDDDDSAAEEADDIEDSDIDDSEGEHFASSMSVPAVDPKLLARAREIERRLAREKEMKHHHQQQHQSSHSTITSSSPPISALSSPSTSSRGNNSNRELLATKQLAPALALPPPPPPPPSSSSNRNSGSWTCLCGVVNKEGFNFCGLCGNRPRDATKWVCTNCGCGDNEPIFKFCVGCGTER